MAYVIPNGAQIAIANGYGTVATMSAITNATSAVATLSASHGVTVNDIVEITSGWSRLNNRILKATAVATNDVTFGGIDTSSTTIYPAGSGTGSVREITGWTQLTQILSSSSSGGEQQFLEFQFLESDAQQRIPTIKNARGLAFSIADDPTLAGQILAQQANDDRLYRALRVTLPSGKIIYYNAYISLGEPSLTVNELMSVEVTLSLVSQATRY